MTGIPKESEEDTTLSTSNVNGDKLVIPVPKGTKLIISTAGLHYNRKPCNDFKCRSVTRLQHVIGKILMNLTPRASLENGIVMPFCHSAQVFDQILKVNSSQKNYQGSRACLGKRYRKVSSKFKQFEINF